MEAAEFNAAIKALIDAWCERKDYGGLSTRLLPAWIYNNGLTDGWEELADALRTCSQLPRLPAQERDTLKRLWIEADVMLRNR